MQVSRKSQEGSSSLDTMWQEPWAPCLFPLQPWRMRDITRYSTGVCGGWSHNLVHPRMQLGTGPSEPSSSLQGSRKGVQCAHLPRAVVGAAGHAQHLPCTLTTPGCTLSLFWAQEPRAMALGPPLFPATGEVEAGRNMGRDLCKVQF